MSNSRGPIRQKSRKIAKKYQISHHLAAAVAKGDLTLGEAVRQHHQAEAATDLVQEHGISRAEAFEVLRKEILLEDLLLKKQRRTHLDKYRYHSIFQQAFDAKNPLQIWLYGQKNQKGKILSLDNYTFVWSAEEGEREIPKLEVKAASFGDFEHQIDDEQLQMLGPIARIEQRFRISNNKLYAFLQNKTLLRIEIREGLVFSGSISWIGQYEIGISNQQGQELSILRHALHQVKVKS